MKEKYMELLEEVKALGEKMMEDEAVEWDDFMEEVEYMDEHLEIALRILKGC